MGHFVAEAGKGRKGSEEKRREEKMGVEGKVASPGVMGASLKLAPALWRLIGNKFPFFLPLSHSAPSLPMYPLEFCGQVNCEELQSWGYPTVKTA